MAVVSKTRTRSVRELGRPPLCYKLPLVIDPVALQMVLGLLVGWLDRRERRAVAYLVEENRLLRRQLGNQRLRLTDDDRRRLTATHTGSAVRP